MFKVSAGLGYVFAAAITASAAQANECGEVSLMHELGLGANRDNRVEIFDGGRIRV